MLSCFIQPLYGCVTFTFYSDDLCRWWFLCFMPGGHDTESPCITCIKGLDLRKVYISRLCEIIICTLRIKQTLMLNLCAMVKFLWWLLYTSLRGRVLQKALHEVRRCMFSMLWGQSKALDYLQWNTHVNHFVLPFRLFGPGEITRPVHYSVCGGTSSASLSCSSCKIV